MNERDERNNTRSDADPLGVLHAGRGWQLCVCVLFVLLIFAVPVSQAVMERQRGEEAQELSIFGSFPTLPRIKAYERALERNSYLGKAVRRTAQWAVLHGLRAGNEKAVIGREQALFYRPSLDAVMAPGFMADPKAEGHPLPAIVTFAESLAAQGVHLIVLIVPGKETIYPEWLAGRLTTCDEPPRNVHTPAFIGALTTHGIEVIDATPILWAGKREAPMFLDQDTHWTPEGLALVADALAERVLKVVEPGDTDLTPQTLQVVNRGDLYDMLDLPERSTYLRPQPVHPIRVAHASTGEPVEPDPASPVVLLGDSFTNIYSVAAMGWGDHAGLAEQLALRLRRPIDAIAQNDGGVNTSRGTLCRRPRPLAGKRVVVWQFAERDLVISMGEWHTMEIKRR